MKENKENKSNEGQKGFIKQIKNILIFWVSLTLIFLYTIVAYLPYILLYIGAVLVLVYCVPLSPSSKVSVLIAFSSIMAILVSIWKYTKDAHELQKTRTF